jgi:hypothetical protein
MFSLIIDSVFGSPYKPLLDGFRDFSQYSRRPFAERIRRAAWKSQRVPYFGMLQIWYNSVAQHLRPFVMA